MLIIVSRDHPGFYKALKRAQEANGRDRVILDRRLAERRPARAPISLAARRDGERRVQVSAAERALMNVLGFMVLHRELAVRTGQRAGARVRKPPTRTPAPDPAQESATARRLRRAAG